MLEAGSLEALKWLQEEFLKWSSVALAVISGPSRRLFWRCGTIWGMLITSCLASVWKSFKALPRSLSPLLKKKLAASEPDLLKGLAIVREMVDFPVPAILFYQNMRVP